MLLSVGTLSWSIYSSNCRLSTVEPFYLGCPLSADTCLHTQGLCRHRDGRDGTFLVTSDRTEDAIKAEQALGPGSLDQSGAAAADLPTSVEALLCSIAALLSGVTTWAFAGRLAGNCCFESFPKDQCLISSYVDVSLV